jgi:hypothetical protein
MSSVQGAYQDDDLDWILDCDVLSERSTDEAITNDDDDDDNRPVRLTARETAAVVTITVRVISTFELKGPIEPYRLTFLRGFVKTRKILSQTNDQLYNTIRIRVPTFQALLG